MAKAEWRACLLAILSSAGFRIANHGLRVCITLLTPEPERLTGTRENRYFRGLRWALGQGRAIADQVATVSTYLNEVKAEHPGAAEMLDMQRRRLSIIPGAVAQNIVGADMEGFDEARRTNPGTGDTPVLPAPRNPLASAGAARLHAWWSKAPAASCHAQ